MYRNGVHAEKEGLKNRNSSYRAGYPGFNNPPTLSLLGLGFIKKAATIYNGGIKPRSARIPRQADGGTGRSGVNGLETKRLKSFSDFGTFFPIKFIVSIF
jgi:hypothetical protein